MKPPLKHNPPGSPGDWLAHAESDLNLARVARVTKDVLPDAVETRYPGHLEEITPSDVEGAIHLADAVLRWAASTLGGR